MFLGQFSCQGCQGVDFVCLLYRFGAMPKNHVFLIRQSSITNILKSVLRAPGGAPAIIDSRVQAIWPPRPGTIIKETGNKSDEQIRREIYHANGPVARRIYIIRTSYQICARAI
jgi:hypothetical protein